MSQKIVVSKEGFNVLTETDPKNLIFSSDFNHLKNKIASTYTQTVANNANHTTTIPHGLSSVHPLAVAYFRIVGDPKWYIATVDFGLSFSGRFTAPVECEIYTDTVNVYIKLYNSSGSSKDIEVQYEIFYENA